MTLHPSTVIRQVKPPRMAVAAPGRFGGYLGSPGGFRRPQRVEFVFNRGDRKESRRAREAIWGKAVQYG